MGIHLGPEELKESMNREPTRLELKVANLWSAEVFCLPLRIFRDFKISVPRFFFKWEASDEYTELFLLTTRLIRLVSCLVTCALAD